MTVAGKTGTTNDNYDRYFAGYTPYYSAAVWVGYKDKPEYIPAGSKNPAALAWKMVMEKVHEGLEDKGFFERPEGITSVQVCADCGLKPSARGELEITDVNLEYLRRGQLQVIPLEKNITWLDAGTADSLLAAGETIKHIQDTTGRYVGCLEELALYEGWVTEEQVHRIGDELSMTLYGKYLQCL